MKTLNIIGCGDVGKTFGYLFQHQNILNVQGLFSRTKSSAQKAQVFIGAGTVFDSLDDMPSTDFIMLSVSDSSIDEVAKQLAEIKNFNKNTVVFHCSGIMTSENLAPCTEKGARIASCHPMQNFSNPDDLVHHFSGVHCAIEGDTSAVEELSALFNQIGAIAEKIATDKYSLYHAAGVFACNYMNAISEVALQSLEEAGIKRDNGLQLLKPLMSYTLDSILKNGPKKALSGPVSRGEVDTVKKHIAALDDWDQEYSKLYRQLAKVLVPMSSFDETTKDEFEQLLFNT